MSQHTNVVACMLLFWLATVGTAASAAYPERPVRLIVAYPAGASTNDILGRALAEKLSGALGQTVVVENRPGAGGTIGTALAAQAQNDGYTLLLGANGPMSISPHVLKLTYDPRRDFEPITLFAIVPYVITINPSLPAKTLEEFVALAKREPGELKYASAGIASTPHLCGELFKTVTGTRLLHVPYKGGAPATASVVAGETQMYCAGAVAQAGSIRAGRLRGLVSTWKTRLPALPDVPSAAEAGVPDLEVASWNGVLAPKGTPRAIVERLHHEIVKIVGTPEMRDFLVKQGVEIETQGPQEFGRFIATELDRWGDVIRKAGITIQ
ncbi:MAG: Bug family tripartite tricarboxylate transporter substrate binding protein [Rhodospirillaceae bacterium]